MGGGARPDDQPQLRAFSPTPPLRLPKARRLLFFPAQPALTKERLSLFQEYFSRLNPYEFQVPKGTVGEESDLSRAYQHVYMVWACSGFYNFYPFLLAQFPQYHSYILFYLAIYLHPPVLGRKDDVILTSPTLCSKLLMSLSFTMKASLLS